MLLRPLGRPAEGIRPAVLVAQTEHQLEELTALASWLDGAGVPTTVVVPEPPSRPLMAIRPAVRRHRGTVELASRLGWAAGTALEADALLAEAGVLLVMNDWGVPRDLVLEARRLGIPTIAWIEGVQDFDDVDTGRSRRPYRTADLVLCLGDHGHDALEGVDRVIVGSERLRRLWEREASPMPSVEQVAVNANFSYGVMVEHRRSWMRGVLAAADSAGIACTVTRHPADRGLTGRHRTSRRPAVDVLETSTIMVSRFSTLIYEALLLGIATVYHNPHGEQVPTFNDPVGAFAATDDPSALAELLRESPRGRGDVRLASAGFLSRHLLLDGSERPVALAGREVQRLRREA